MRLVNEPFDGCGVVSTTFGDISRYSRFFTEDGTGCTKISDVTYVDDYYHSEIVCDSNITVWVNINGK